MTPQKPVSDADIEAAVRAELPWLLERSRARAMIRSTAALVTARFTAPASLRVMSCTVWRA
jgi:hypothetical protein